jgi:hypothetical protein
VLFPKDLEYVRVSPHWLHNPEINNQQSDAIIFIWRNQARRRTLFISKFITSKASALCVIDALDCVRENNMKDIERIFQKVIWDSFLFFLVSCILLFPWLFVAHAIEEKTDVAVISLPLAFTCVVIAFSFLSFKRNRGH